MSPPAAHPFRRFTYKEPSKSGSMPGSSWPVLCRPESAQPVLPAYLKVLVYAKLCLVSGFQSL